MKLRHQIMILLLVPVICQACMMGILMDAVTRVDAAVKEEQRAKEIIGEARELDRLLSRCIMSMAGASLGATDASDFSRKIVRDRMDRLINLIGSDPRAAKLVSKQKSDIDRLLTNLADFTTPLAHNDTKLFLAQFANNEELREALMINFDEITRDSEQLMAIYKPMTVELRPQAVKARANLQKVLIAMMATSISLVGIMAYLVNKQTLTRLQILMQNIRDFSMNKRALTKLQGRDELAELDQAFQTMSKEKFHLDETQKSLRAMVSHDLRSPLTSMTLTLELILELRHDELDARTLDSLRKVYSDIKRLSRLAKTLLDIEKLEGGQLNFDVRENDWEDLINQSLASVESLASKKKIKLETSLPDSATLLCDSDRTIQCIVNLLSNAIKFSPVDSVVKLQVCPARETLQRLEVIDSGPGVPESKVDQLFNKFIQLDQPDATKKEGTGLGLYICRLLIEAQGGQVGYRSTESAGSCFFIELPAATKTQWENPDLE